MRMHPDEEAGLAASYKLTKFMAEWFYPPMFLSVLLRMTIEPFTDADWTAWWMVADAALLLAVLLLWRGQLREMSALREKLRKAHE